MFGWERFARSAVGNATYGHPFHADASKRQRRRHGASGNDKNIAPYKDDNEKTNGGGRGFSGSGQAFECWLITRVPPSA
jgi:hypothetical protein